MGIERRYKEHDQNAHIPGTTREERERNHGEYIHMAYILPVLFVLCPILEI